MLEIILVLQNLLIVSEFRRFILYFYYGRNLKIIYIIFRN